MTVEWLDWTGCYDMPWGTGIISKASYTHPAKASRGLLRRIFSHMESQGWLKPRSRILDVFGGIGTTAIEGASLGHEVVCIELEEKFVTLAKENIAMHRRMWEAAGDPIPVIIHGDSRKAASLVREHFAAVVSSPPYEVQTIRNRDIGDGHKQVATQGKHSFDEYGQTEGQIGAMPEGNIDAVVSSPPYAPNEKSDYLLSEDGKTRARDENRGHSQGNGCFRGSETYGDTEGQLGSLREGDFDAVIGSPPFENQEPSHAQGTKFVRSKQVEGRSFVDAEYGNTPGQIGILPPGTVDAVVGSPPFEKGADGTLRAEKFADPEAFAEKMTAADGKGTRKSTTKKSRVAQMKRDGGATYGETAGQIGNTQGETFWTEARKILEQVYQLLPIGGYSAWILKSYVKKGIIVDFPGNWCRLCEAVGFRIVQRARCHLVKEETNPGLFGDVTKKTSRKSFFRRLNEKRGAPLIDFEEVVFAIKN